MDDEAIVTRAEAGAHARVRGGEGRITGKGRLRRFGAPPRETVEEGEGEVRIYFS